LSFVNINQLDVTFGLTIDPHS